MVNRIALVVFLFLFGTGMTVGGSVLVSRQRRAQSFVPVRAQIVDRWLAHPNGTRVEAPPHTIPEQQSRRGGVTPVFRFSYKVGERPYTSEGFRAVRFRGTFQRAWGVYDRYRPGETVTAYYDPERPSVAVLERGGSAAPILFLACGLVAIAAGAVAGAFFYVRTKGSRLPGRPNKRVQRARRSRAKATQERRNGQASDGDGRSQPRR